VPEAASPEGPLHGLVVLDLSQALAGPHATMMLGDLGARVIKVERPGPGDDSRSWGPPFVGPASRPTSTYFLSCNRNKESIVLDLKTEQGLRTLRRLARHADVLVENFRPGVLDRLGLDTGRLHQLNPGLVICSISGFGHDGPAAGRAGYDQIAQGEAGLMSLTGPGPDQPTKMGVPIGDLLAGLHAVSGILAALHARAHTGRGDVVRTSLLAALVGVHAYQGTRYTVAGEVPRAGGNHHPSIAPYGTFRCADGVIQIAAANEGLWRRTARVLELPVADPRFVDNAARVRHRDALTELIEQRLSSRERDHWLGAFAQAGVPAGAIRTLDEVYRSDQVRAQGLLLDVEHPELGEIQLPGPALRFDQHQRRAHRAPPGLGQDAEHVLGWLDERDAEFADPPVGL
jgi:crotonobetainyl-CoA:carnitine CoA-transferase CaiB-like acyl-CoA transferase